jgi:UDP-2-acetamido-3-amino-2,3-dideoxy-glucuronate N-acetyltransferase
MSKAFVHPQAICETTAIGDRTRVWAFAHILPGAVVGSDCNICDGVFIENDVVVGHRVTVKCGVQLWDGLRVEDDVFIGPNATFTNDRFPRSRVRPPAFLRTILRQGASIGANATILPGIEIGRGAMIGAGAVVTRSVPPNAIVSGNPARITGYTGTHAQGEPVLSQPVHPSSADARVALNVANAALLRLRRVGDIRGDLTVAEFASELPFRPERYFLVFNVPTRETRGEHAHRKCHQVLICTHGSCSVLLDDGTHREEVRLDRPEVALYMPPLIWGTQYRYTRDAVLLVFASHPYDPADYIRTYDEFLAAVSSNPS